MLNLVEMSCEGFWHCEHCDRVVHLAGDPESPARCPHCKRQTAVWHPPFLADEKNPSPQPAGLARTR